MKRTQYISASALFSGFTAKAYGGDFWEGATISALNHLSHSFSNDIITQISNYVEQYFNSPGVLNPPPFVPQFPTGPNKF